MTLAPNPGFPERVGNTYETKVGQNNVRRGPLRFEEGVATDTDVPNDFAKGVAWGIAAWGLGNLIYNTGYQSYKNPYPTPPVQSGNTTIINYSEPLWASLTAAAAAPEAAISAIDFAG